MPDINFRLTATDEATPVIERAQRKLARFNDSYGGKAGGGGGGAPGELPAYQPNYQSKMDGLLGNFFGSFSNMLPGGMRGAMPSVGAEGLTGQASTGQAAAGGAAGGAMAGMGMVALLGAVKSGMDKVSEYTQKLWQITVESTPQLKATIQWIYDALALSLYPIGQAISMALIPIAEAITNISSDLLVKFGDINIDNPEEIKEYIVEMVERYAGFAAELIVEMAPPIMLALIEAGLRAFVALFIDFGNWAWAGLTGAISSAWEMLSPFGTWIWDGITGFISSNFPVLADLGTWVWNGLKNLIGSGWSVLSGIGGWVYMSINTALSGIGGEAYKALHNAVASLLNSIATIELPLVGKPFKGLLGTIPMLSTGGMITGDGMAYLHAGERVLNTAETKRTSPMGMGQGVTIQINAPVYGVSDLESAIESAIRRSQMGYASYR